MNAQLILRRSSYFVIRNLFVFSMLLTTFGVFSWGSEIFQDYQLQGHLIMLSLFILGNAFLYLSWRMDYIIIKDDGLIECKGILFRQQNYYTFQNIDTISVKQNVLGLLLNFGNIRFFSPFSEEPHRLIGIPNPMENAQKIEALIPRDIPIQATNPKSFRHR